MSAISRPAIVAASAGPRRFAGDRALDKALLLFLFALFLLLSPLTRWWAGEGAPWYLLFVVWGGIILLAALLQLAHRRQEGNERGHEL